MRWLQGRGSEPWGLGLEGTGHCCSSLSLEPVSCPQEEAVDSQHLGGLHRKGSQSLSSCEPHASLVPPLPQAGPGSRGPRALGLCSQSSCTPDTQAHGRPGAFLRDWTSRLRGTRQWALVALRRNGLQVVRSHGDTEGTSHESPVERRLLWDANSTTLRKANCADRSKTCGPQGWGRGMSRWNAGTRGSAAVTMSPSSTHPSKPTGAHTKSKPGVHDLS